MREKELLELLEGFRTRCLRLRKTLRSDMKYKDNPSDARVSKQSIRQEAHAIADTWLHTILPLTTSSGLYEDQISDVSYNMERFYVLSRPNNRVTSYIEVLNKVTERFDDRFILPLKLPNRFQQNVTDELVVDIENISSSLSDDELGYLNEANECSKHHLYRASIVMGWCCVIARLQNRILELGFDILNSTSKSLKAKTTGRFKRYNKEFNVSTVSELQEVFDTDLITIFEGLQVIDNNEHKRLMHCFDLRNQSAHPGSAPINEENANYFFSEIVEIIFKSGKFNISTITP